MRLGKIAILVLLAVLPGAGGLRAQVSADEQPLYVATVPPLAMILREVAGERGEVKCLLGGGSSPHTYAPRPSDAAACGKALRVFMVSPELEPWAGDLAPAERMVRVIDLVPKNEKVYFEHAHGHGDHEGHDHANTMVHDPHFWTDPTTVKSMVPGLTAALTRADPLGEAAYRKNSEKFSAMLEALVNETKEMLAPVGGESVILFHPSFNYLLRRHGIVVAGVLEQTPGKSPTPREILALAKTVKRAGVKAIFTEPQLPRRAAEVLAETAGVKLFTLDPMGGGAGTEDYAALVRSNSQTLAEALR